MESVNSQVNGKPKTYQHEALVRLFHMGYNCMPVNGKHPPFIKWKHLQEEKHAEGEDYALWHRQFHQRGLLNWGLLTGKKPYSDSPGLVVVDSDDAEGDELVKSRCPDTPVQQRTGKNGFHRVYRRPPVSEVPYI